MLSTPDNNMQWRPGILQQCAPYCRPASHTIRQISTANTKALLQSSIWTHSKSNEECHIVWPHVSIHTESSLNIRMLTYAEVCFKQFEELLSLEDFVRIPDDDSVRIETCSSILYNVISLCLADAFHRYISWTLHTTGRFAKAIHWAQHEPFS